MYASPAFVAGGGVIALLYGMVLFAVLSGQRPDTEEAYDEPPPPPTLALREPVSPPPAPEVNSARAPEPAKPPEVKKTVAAPKPAEPPPPEKVSPPPTPPPVAKEEAAPAPPKAKGATTLAKGRKAPPSPPTDATAVALNTVAKPAEPASVASVEGPTFPGLSPWLDPERSSRPAREDEAIVLAVPAGIHILSPELKHKDSPRSLTEVTGDFEVRVRVGGKIRPGSEPLPKVPVPIAFQGAGLLLWHDEDNYLRFERAAMSGPKQPLSQKVMVEVCHEGKPGNFVYKDTPDRPVILRMTRKGDDLECAYSPDGKTWIVIKKSSIALFPDKVQVGIAASNLSPKPFAARFEAFTLERGAGKGASH